MSNDLERDAEALGERVLRSVRRVERGYGGAMLDGFEGVVVGVQGSSPPKLSLPPSSAQATGCHGSARPRIRTDGAVRPSSSRWDSAQDGLARRDERNNTFPSRCTPSVGRHTG
jgi:hypothetical protein